MRSSALVAFSPRRSCEDDESVESLRSGFKCGFQYIFTGTNTVLSWTQRRRVAPRDEEVLAGGASCVLVNRSHRVQAAGEAGGGGGYAFYRYILSVSVSVCFCVRPVISSCLWCASLWYRQCTTILEQRLPTTSHPTYYMPWYRICIITSFCPLLCKLCSAWT